MPKVQIPVEADTERAFLDAAEQLFADRGFEGAKVRAIAEMAGANLGALHYYWGSKEELFRAVWHRRLDSLALGRTRKFDELRQKAAAGGITLEEVLTVMLETSFGVAEWDEYRSEHFQKLYARALTEPSPMVRNVVNQYFDERAKGFVELIRLACPDLGQTELHWGLHAVFGTILNVHIDGGRMSRVGLLTGDDIDLKQGSKQMARFLAAGFREMTKTLKANSYT